MLVELKLMWIQNAYTEYVDRWLWDKWGYARGWLQRLPEMLLWYSAAGAAMLSEEVGDGFVKKVRSGHPDLLPGKRRGTWDAAVKLATEICRDQGANPVDWFTGGCGDIEVAWRGLDDIPYVGPKIASFLMRDLSYLRDYSDGQGGMAVSYGNNIDRRWFHRLMPEDQALFIPIDVYVHTGAIRHRASPSAAKYDAPTIQSDPDLHRQVATEIVGWARKLSFDARDLDVYWYSLGAGDIHADGTAVA